MTYIVYKDSSGNPQPLDVDEWDAEEIAKEIRILHGTALVVKAANKKAAGEYAKAVWQNQQQQQKATDKK